MDRFQAFNPECADCSRLTTPILPYLLRTIPHLPLSHNQRFKVGPEYASAFLHLPSHAFLPSITSPSHISKNFSLSSSYSMRQLAVNLYWLDIYLEFRTPLEEDGFRRKLSSRRRPEFHKFRASDCTGKVTRELLYMLSGEMDVPPTLLQSEPEVASPVYALGEDTPGTIQPDLSNPSHRNILRTTARIDASNLGLLLHCHLQALRSLMARSLIQL